MLESINSNGTRLSVPSLQLKSAPALPTLSPDSIARTLGDDKRQLNKSFMLILLSSFQKIAAQANTKENERWHSMFRTIPTWDTLFASYDCVLHRGDNNIKQLMFPYIGELFISSKYLCFATKNYQFGWLFTRLQISLFEIVNIHKLVDGIIVETNLGKIQLNAFTELDTVYQTLYLVWRQNSIQSGDLEFAANGKKRNNQALLDMVEDTLNRSHSNGLMTERAYLDPETGKSKDVQEDMITEIINSIDGDSSIVEIDNLKRLKETIPVYKLKASENRHNFSFDGPLSRDSYQEVVKPSSAHKNEFILQDKQYSISPGLLFELLFSESDNRFLMDTYGKAKCTDIVSFRKFVGQKRSYSYSKPLNFSIGPKSTICEVSEEIIHYDPHNYIELISTTQTPNVPSGNAFNIKTRYLMWWTDKNKCNLQLSYWVNWTSSSWIKNMIETSCRTGVMESLATFNETLNEYLDKYVECSMGGNENYDEQVPSIDKLSELSDNDNAEMNNEEETGDASETSFPKAQEKHLHNGNVRSADTDTETIIVQKGNNLQSNTIIALLAMNLMAMLYLVWLTKTQTQSHSLWEVLS